MWGIIFGALQLVLGLFGLKKSDPSKPTVEEVVKPAVEAAKAQVHEQIATETTAEVQTAIKAGDAVASNIVQHPSSLRDRDEFSAD